MGVVGPEHNHYSLGAGKAFLQSVLQVNILGLDMLEVGLRHIVGYTFLVVVVVVLL